MVTSLPTTFSIWPRMRTVGAGGAGCAPTAELATISERLAKLNVRRVIACILLLPGNSVRLEPALLLKQFHPAGTTPAGRQYSPIFRGLSRPGRAIAASPPAAPRTR